MEWNHFLFMRRLDGMRAFNDHPLDVIAAGAGVAAASTAMSTSTSSAPDSSSDVALVDSTASTSVVVTEVDDDIAGAGNATALFDDAVSDVDAATTGANWTSALGITITGATNATAGNVTLGDTASGATTATDAATSTIAGTGTIGAVAAADVGDTTTGTGKLGAATTGATIAGTSKMGAVSTGTVGVTVTAGTMTIGAAASNTTGTVALGDETTDAAGFAWTSALVDRFALFVMVISDEVDSGSGAAAGDFLGEMERRDRRALLLLAPEGAAGEGGATGLGSAEGAESIDISSAVFLVLAGAAAVSATVGSNDKSFFPLFLLPFCSFTAFWSMSPMDGDGMVCAGGWSTCAEETGTGADVD
jgi:hypothetical protein